MNSLIAQVVLDAKNDSIWSDSVKMEDVNAFLHQFADIVSRSDNVLLSQALEALIGMYHPSPKSKDFALVEATIVALKKRLFDKS